MQVRLVETLLLFDQTVRRLVGVRVVSLPERSQSTNLPVLIIGVTSSCQVFECVHHNLWERYSNS